MGQRANLIIIEGGQRSMYYTHWAANRLDRDLFWGPEHATAFIRRQQVVDEAGWLDDVWAEGGAVVDHDQKVLLIFGGEDVLYDIPLRRIWLEMIRVAWRGWEIRWAHEGIADMADYVGYPRDKVLSGNYDRVCSLKPPDEKDWTDCVASIRFIDGRQVFYPVQGNADDHLACGPDILNECDHNEGCPSLPLDEWVRSFPTSGFCIDIARKQVDYWAAGDIPGAPDHIARQWSGWTVHWHRDAYENQLAAGSGQLRFPVQSKEELQGQIIKMLLYQHSRSEVDFLLKVTEKSRQEGKTVEINSWALRDDHLEAPIAVRREILAAVLAELDAKKS